MWNYSLTPWTVEYRTLADEGVKTIGEAKAKFIKDAHKVYTEDHDFAVINAIDLKASGRRMVKELVRQGYARPVFENAWPENEADGACWVVTREQYAAENLTGESSFHARCAAKAKRQGCDHIYASQVEKIKRIMQGGQ